MKSFCTQMWKLQKTKH